MLTIDEVKHIAELARIGLNKEELKQYQKNLSSILDYFKKLEELDTSKINEIGHITGRKNVYRQEDKVINFDEKKRQKIMKNIPEIKDNKIKVRTILEGN